MKNRHQTFSYKLSPHISNTAL